MYAKIVNKETKQCQIGTGTNIKYYQSIGMTEMEVEQAYNGCWYVKGYAPQETLEQKNEKIRAERQSRYVAESDMLKLDYDEAVARNSEDIEEKKQLWLSSKDKIREELPYLIGA